MIFHFCPTKLPIYRANFDAIFRKNEVAQERLTEEKPKRKRRAKQAAIDPLPPSQPTDVL